ncbi:MAG: hypothetical protein H7832_06580 [Magnetococcus sp. DMHC-6]
MYPSIMAKGNKKSDPSLSNSTAYSAGVDNLPRIASREETQQHLHQLIQEAKMERLECALPMIESLNKALTLEYTANGAPPGTLTVEGWFSLLNRWERQILTLTPRQLQYTKEFFQDLLPRFEKLDSPLTSILGQLALILATQKSTKPRVSG